MEILSSTMGTILAFILVITIVIFFHELGHFWIARLCRVRVSTFSIGFGHAIVKWMDKHGTQWRISWIPLGGYVKFAGDSNAASMPDKSQLANMSDEQKNEIFYFKPLWQRIAIVAAGPLANFVLAIVIFTGLYSVIGQNIILPIVDNVTANSPAEQAGFMPGDVILAMDGEEVESFADVRRIVAVNYGTPIDFTIERGGVRTHLLAVPQLRTEQRFGNRVGWLGIASQPDPSRIAHKRYHPLAALAKGAGETIFIIEQTFIVLKRILFQGQGADSLGGPIKIAQISGQTAASGGLPALFNLIAIISVSIGLINLFPIPMLDGGHLLFYAYEGIVGRPLPQKVQAYGFRLGLVLILALFVFVTWNDLT